MRLAFTIVLNGEHHLKHNDHFLNMIPHFDKWVFAEGAVKPVGSTSWCKNIDEQFTKDGSSVDNTLEYLEYLKQTYPDKVDIIKSPNGFWNGKDEQVNACMAKLREFSNKGFLWQFDVDEQWSLLNIERAENTIISGGYRSLACYCNCFVGKDIIAVGGNWGGDTIWMRVWNWNGEDFVTHEPPDLNCADRGNFIFIRERMFNHYSYYFEKDVLFKSKFYGGHENVYDGWKVLRDMSNDQFPCGINVLFGNTDYGNRISGNIIKI